MLTLVGSRAAFELSVSDDGRGFDPAQFLDVDRGPHLGVALMSDVAAAIGAELAVSSAPGRGTRWSLTVRPQ